MIRAFLTFVLMTGSAQALELTVPNATVTQTEQPMPGSVRLPQRPWAPGQVTNITEGQIERQSLRTSQPTLTTLQLLRPLQDLLEDEGYQEVFSCADASCGGFDFRFQLDLLPAPDMYVDLGDYRYLLMKKPNGEPHTVGLVASRSRNAGFIHITKVSTAEFPQADVITEQAAPITTVGPTGIVEALTKDGHAVLADLDFGTGSADLGAGPYGSLQALSAWLETNPAARIVLVGHTDAVGSLEANVNLSRRRALSVVERLTSAFGSDPAQLEAAGAGYLSPLASNVTEEGRAVNRRVEVVLLSIGADD